MKSGLCPSCRYLPETMFVRRAARFSRTQVRLSHLSVTSFDHDSSCSGGILVICDEDVRLKQTPSNLMSAASCTTDKFLSPHRMSNFTVSIELQKFTRRDDQNAPSAGLTKSPIFARQKKGCQHLSSTDRGRVRTVSRAACWPNDNRRDMRAFPCSPPSPGSMWWTSNVIFTWMIEDLTVVATY